MPPGGIFGIPHGLTSSTDEQISFAIGAVALLVAVFYDGDLDVGPASVAGGVGVLVSRFGTLVAPQAISNEWRVPVPVVLLMIVSVLIAHRRR